MIEYILDMNQEIIIISIIIVLSIVLVFYFLNKKISELNKPKNDDVLLEWLKSMQKSIDLTNKNLNDSLRQNNIDLNKTLVENSKQLNDRLDNAAKIINQVTSEIGQMSEIGRSMKDLQNYLNNPKIRGNLGEQVLRDLITQMFPKSSFYLQYQFKSGNKVDAAILTDAGIIPIDSKFPLENFQKLSLSSSQDGKLSIQKLFVRDVVKHIDDIAEKYIVIDENTMDFALMYLPSEAIYYEVVNNQEIMNHAKKKRVYPVSPSTLYAHLQTILLSFEGKKIEKKAREVFRFLQTLSVEHEKIMENVLTLGNHMKNSNLQFNKLSGTLDRFGSKIKQVEKIEPDKLT